MLALLALACLLILGVAARQLARMQGQLQPLIQQELAQTLGRAVHIGAVQLHGLNRLTLTDVRVARGSSFSDGVALAAPRAEARVNLFTLAFHRDESPLAAIGCVEVTRPRVAISRSDAGRWDFQDIVDRIHAHSLGAIHADFVLDDGKVAYRDARGFGASVDPLHTDLVAVNVRVHAHGDNNYSFRASGQDALDRMGPMEVAGVYSGHADAVRVNANATHIAVDELARYLPRDWPLTFQDGTAALRVTALIKNLLNQPRALPLPATELTAELDLTGVGLRLRDMSAPIMATSGRLILIHDPGKNPQNSQLQFRDVHAHAGAAPVTLSGQLTGIDLFDLAHSRPQLSLAVQTSVQDGRQLLGLFPNTDWLCGLQLGGPTRVSAHVSGRFPDITVDGSVEGNGLAVAGLRGDGINAHFLTRLGTGPSALPTIQLSARLHRATIGVARANDVYLGLVSFTPQRQLTTAPQLTGSVTARQVYLPWGEAADVNGAVAVSRAELQVSDLRAGVFGGEVQGKIEIPRLAGGVTRADGTFRKVDLAMIAHLLHQPALQGTGSGSFGARREAGGQWALTAHLAGQNLVYQRYHAQSVDAQLIVLLSSHLITVEIPTLAARTDHGNFTLTGGVYSWDAKHPGAGTWRLPVHGAQIPLQAFGYTELQGAGSLDGLVTGDPLHPTLTAHIGAANGVLFGQHYQQAQGEMIAGLGQLTFHQLSFSRAGMTLQIVDDAQGFNPQAGVAGLKAQLQLHGAPLDEVLALFGQHSPWLVTGGVQGVIDLQPADGKLRLSGMASIPHAVVAVSTWRGPYPLHLDKLGITFSYVNRALQMSDIELTRGATTLHGTGTVGEPEGQKLTASLAFTGNGVQLADLPLDLFGLPVAVSGPATVSATVDGVLHGDGPQPLLVNVAVQSPLAAIEGFPVGAGKVDLTYSYRPHDQQLIIHDGSVDNPAFRATATGRYSVTQGTFDQLAVDFPRLDLAGVRELVAQADELPVALRLLAPALTGHGQATVTANGNATQPDIALAFGLDDLAVNGTALPNLHGHVASETVGGHYRLRLDEVTADDPAGTAQARVTGILDPQDGPDVQFTARDITAQLLAPWLGMLPVDGRLALAGSWRGSWAQPQVDADAQVTDPVIDGYALRQITGHLQLANDRLTLTHGQAQLPNGGAPLAVAGEIPLRWSGWRPDVPADEPLAVTVTLPEQALSAFPTHLALAPDFSGTVAGALRVTGTLAAPHLDTGWLTASGAADLRLNDPAFPNCLQDLALRLDLAGNTLTVTHFNATLDRREQGTRPRNFAPGWVAAQGTVRIPLDKSGVSSPNDWRWNLYAEFARAPLPQSLMAVPHASGLLHLESEHGVPVLHGVLLAEQVKVKEPHFSTHGLASPTAGFNPRFSLVLQVGDGVKVSRGLFTVALRPTPLPWPALPVVTGNTPPTLTVQPDQPAYAEDAAQFTPGAGETPGTWGVLTGSLADPHFYARFEVGKVGFPLNLFSSIRNAKGRITFNQADGVHFVMGIHDAPTTAATAPVRGMGLR